MEPLSLIAGGTQLLGGLVSGLFGGGQKREARRIMRKNIRPEYTIPQEVVNAAATGLPSEQYNQAMQNIKRQQSFAISKAQDRRGGLGSLAGIQANTNDAMLGLDVANADARMRNRQILAQYRDKAFDWNKRQKFIEQQNYAMALMGAGNANISNAIDQGIAGAGYLGMGLLGNKKSKQPIDVN